MSEPKFQPGQSVIYTDPDSDQEMALRIEKLMSLPGPDGTRSFQLYHVSGGMGAPRYVAADAEHLLRLAE